MNGQDVEQRQRARISWRFWVAVEGVDDYPRLRNGNISFTGVYFETDGELGELGSVQWLYLAATEQGQPLEVMARVIRVATLEDVRRGSVPVGIALEFMPEREEVRGGLQSLVREIGTMRLEEQEQAVQAADSRAAPLPRRLSVQDLQLETDWKLVVGETVHLELRVHQTGRRGIFEGKVVEAVPLPEQRARVRVQIVGEAADEPGAAPDVPPRTLERREALDLLFADLDVENPPEQGEQLIGSLARIRLSSLLSFFDLERISGVLHLAHDAEQATMYFRDGQLVDVDPSDAPIKAVVSQLLGWTGGTFEFVMGAVDRPDRVGTTTGALLIELALAQDSQNR